jgi:hypothetical protein
MGRIVEETRHSDILPEKIQNVELVSVKPFTSQRSQPINSDNVLKREPIKHCKVAAGVFLFSPPEWFD